MIASECDFCRAFDKAPLRKWTKFALPFYNLCEKHNEEVQKVPELLKINEEEKKKVKPWPRLMFGKDGYGKIRFKSYLSELWGVSPLTWWASEDFGNAIEEIENTTGITLKEPKIKKEQKTKKVSCRCVCSIVNQLGIFFGNNLEGEIIIKHSPKCPYKIQGTYEWAGAGYQQLEKFNND